MRHRRQNGPLVLAALLIGSALFAILPTAASAQTQPTACPPTVGLNVPGVSAVAGFDYIIDHSGNRDKCRVKNTPVIMDPVCPLYHHLQRRTGRDRCSR